MPAFGQVDGDVAAAVAGGAGGDVDQVAAQGGTADFGVAEAGQRPGGAQQAVADRREGKSGRVGGKRARGQVRQGPAGPVREHLLHHGMVGHGRS